MLRAQLVTDLSSPPSSALTMAAPSSEPRLQSWSTNLPAANGAGQEGDDLAPTQPEPAEAGVPGAEEKVLSCDVSEEEEVLFCDVDEGAFDEHDNGEEEVLSCDVYAIATGDDDVTQRMYCMRDPVAILHGSDSNYGKPAALCWCHRDPPDCHAGNYRIRGPICDTLEVLDVSDVNPQWVSRGLPAMVCRSAVGQLGFAAEYDAVKWKADDKKKRGIVDALRSYHKFGPRICIHYERGWCKLGDLCKFQHASLDLPM